MFLKMVVRNSSHFENCFLLKRRKVLKDSLVHVQLFAHFFSCALLKLVHMKTTSDFKEKIQIHFNT